MIYFWLIPLVLIAVVCLIIFYKAVMRSARSEGEQANGGRGEGKNY